MSVMEIKVTFNDVTAARFQRMLETTGIENEQALIKTALGHMDWLIEQVQDGRTIAALVEDRSTYKELKSGALDHAKENREAQSFVARIADKERLSSLDRAIFDLDPDRDVPTEGRSF